MLPSLPTSVNTYWLPTVLDSCTLCFWLTKKKKKCEPLYWLVLGWLADSLHVAETLTLRFSWRMVIHLELYPFIALSVTLIVVQGYSSVKQFQLKISCSYPIKLQLCRIVRYIKQVMNVPQFFDFCTYSREITDLFPDLTKTLWLFFSWTLVKRGFSNHTLL